MKKRLLTIFIALFFLVCCVPFAAMSLAGAAPAAANEVLPAKPKLIKRGALNTEFLTDLAAYAEKGFRPRLWCITAWDTVSAWLGDSANDDVVLGRDGWLFYFTAADDRAGASRLDDDTIARCAGNLRLMQEYAASQGAQFLFVMPNAKYDLYPEYTRDYVTVAPGRNVDALQAALSEEGVDYCDLYAPFAAQDEILYWHTDSHWNGRGAALAADEILTALGREGGWFDGAFVESEPHRGDLYEMLYPLGTATEPDYEPASGFSFAYESRFTGVNDMEIETGSEVGEGRLLMFRDSFGRNLYPYLAERYEAAAFSRENSYDLTRIAEMDATDVVIELGQRNVEYLVQYTAIFPAPEREGTVLADSKPIDCAVETAATDDVSGCALVTGELQEISAAPVYLLALGRVYEASFTQEGFAAYIPTDAAGDVTVYIGG